MWKSNLLEDNEFWETLCFLEKLTENRSVSQLIQELNITESKLFEVLYFLHNLNYSFDIEQTADGKIMIPPSEEAKIRFDLTLSEWISMQAHFPLIDQAEQQSSFHRTLVKKLEQIEQENSDKDYYQTVPSLACSLDECIDDFEEFKEDKFLPIVEVIETSILEKNSVSIQLENDQWINLLPHRLVYLIQKICLIGEELANRCLVYFKLSEVKDVQLLDSDYQSNFSAYQINQFISDLRSVSESDFRLVLKVKSENFFNFKGKYHHFGRPFIITNMKGDKIWAASVEMNPAIFDWVEEMGENVEVLAPQSFKKAFDQYKMGKKTQTKKAS